MSWFPRFVRFGFLHGTWTRLFIHVVAVCVVCRQEIFYWQLLYNSSTYFACASVWRVPARVCVSCRCGRGCLVFTRVVCCVVGYEREQSAFWSEIQANVNAIIAHPTTAMEFALYSSASEGSLSFLLGTLDDSCVCA